MHRCQKYRMMNVKKRNSLPLFIWFLIVCLAVIVSGYINVNSAPGSFQNIASTIALLALLAFMLYFIVLLLHSFKSSPESTSTTSTQPTRLHYSSEPEPHVPASQRYQPSSQPRFCTSCGAGIEPDGKFCPSCGAAV
nr:zinc ribbon domain-containing protein [Candidatus Sigynarchaeota archaeon]